MNEQNSDAVDMEDLRGLVARVLEIPASEVGDDADFADELDVDSLLELEIAARLEQRYRIAIPEIDIPTLTSLSRVRDLVRRRLDEENP